MLFVRWHFHCNKFCFADHVMLSATFVAYFMLLYTMQGNKLISKRLPPSLFYFATATVNTVFFRHNVLLHTVCFCFSQKLGFTLLHIIYSQQRTFLSTFSDSEFQIQNATSLCLSSIHNHFRYSFFKIRHHYLIPKGLSYFSFLTSSLGSIARAKSNKLI